MWQGVRELWPFVAALYLLECLSWLRPGHRLFASIWPGRWRLLREGLHLAGWLPSARFCVAHELPLVWTPRGVYVPARQELVEGPCWRREGFDFLAYEDLAAEREHHAVRFDLEHVLQLPSRAHAEDVLEQLRALRALPEAARAAYLAEQLRRAGDLAAFRAHDLDLAHERFPLAAVSTMLFVAVFAALPLAAWIEPFEPWLGAVLALCALLYVMALGLAIVFVKRARRRGHARTEGLLLPILLSPPAAIRASAGLLRDLHHRFDPLTIAAALLPRQELLALARAQLCTADLALEDGEEEDWRGFWSERRKMVAGLLAAIGASETEALAAPQRNDAAAAGYCPLCGLEYRSLDVDCAGCAVPVRAFEAGC